VSVVDWAATVIALPALWLHYRPGAQALEPLMVWRFELLKYRPVVSSEESIAMPRCRQAYRR